MNGQFRNMVSADVTRVVAIERTAQTSPWSRLSFEESLNRDHYCRVLDSDQGIVAYHTCSSVLDEVHILNVVVADHCQGQGFGHEIMQDIFDYALSLTAKKMLLEVRAGNHIAQRLYASWGFEQLSLRKKYYQPIEGSGDREDAVVMLRLLE